MRCLRPVLVAFTFLTVIPLPTGRIEAKDLGRAVGYFPLVGAVLGAGLWGLAALLKTLPAPLVGVVLTAVLALMTRGLHLDGLADVFDGLGGGLGSRERTLSIMKDPRVGAFGVTALILALVGKALALGHLAAGAGGALILAGLALSRWTAALLVVTFPYARTSGTGHPFAGGACAVELALASALAALAVIPAGAGALLPGLAALVLALLLAAAVFRRLGGLTGDAYGAAIEVFELTFFLGTGSVL